MLRRGDQCLKCWAGHQLAQVAAKYPVSREYSKEHSTRCPHMTSVGIQVYGPVDICSHTPYTENHIFIISNSDLKQASKEYRKEGRERGMEEEKEGQWKEGRIEGGRKKGRKKGGMQTDKQKE